MAMMLFYRDSLKSVANQPEQGFRSRQSALAWAKVNIIAAIRKIDGSRETPEIVCLSVPIIPFKFTIPAPQAVDTDMIGVFDNGEAEEDDELPLDLPESSELPDTDDIQKELSTSSAPSPDANDHVEPWDV